MKSILSLLILILFSAPLLAETFVVCIGIGKYANPKVQDLAKTEPDAKAMAAFYKKGTENVITITGKYATKDCILKSIKSQFGRAKSGDRIIFYFSGHGYTDGFCPYDMRNREDGLTFSDVINVMNSSEATDKFIFADTCHSGAIRKNNKTTAPNVGNILFFLSSKGNEFSGESSFLSNGYFTKYLLRGLGGGADFNRDRKITASELFNYVNSGVKKLTHNQQHPVMWGKFDHNTVIVEYKTKR